MEYERILYYYRISNEKKQNLIEKYIIETSERVFQTSVKYGRRIHKKF